MFHPRMGGMLVLGVDDVIESIATRLSQMIAEDCARKSSSQRSLHLGITSNLLGVASLGATIIDSCSFFSDCQNPGPSLSVFNCSINVAATNGKKDLSFHAVEHHPLQN